MSTNRPDCTPPVLNPAVPLASLTAGGPGACILPRSSLDLTGRRIVKKGSLVSWGGLRFTVVRVELGRCYYGHGRGDAVGCSVVQVVA
jgi:hypothetical protein